MRTLSGRVYKVKVDHRYCQAREYEILARCGAKAGQAALDQARHDSGKPRNWRVTHVEETTSRTLLAAV